MEASFELQIRNNNNDVDNDNDNKWNSQITVAIMTYTTEVTSCFCKIKMQNSP